MKTHKNLYNKIISIENLISAFKSTAKNKRSSVDYLQFDQWRYLNLNKIHNDLKSGKYQISDYIYFKIKDPKPRNIVALQFRDRIVQRAIFNVIQPIFEKTFLPNSYACREDKGTHKACRITQSYTRKEENQYFLKTDFSKYFMSIDREILWKLIERKIGCKQTLSLIERFVPKTGVGINIGELLSQLFANVYGNQVDMFLKHQLKIKYFARYMDDIVIFGGSYEELKEVKESLEEFSKSIGLRFSKWFINHKSKGVNFVGYRIFPDFKLIRKSSVKRAKRKLNRLSGIDRERFLASWLGHISHANTYNLKKRLNI
ncbi:Retron-type reverse transcriptase [Ignatzschineria indica]|uniref:reverse transcriptase domain-containing protein n=1 Tax=Ignatzschineria indica TaxID=472583 RepID=UPI002576D211|nr:reverse transcriptase domain-containing protein [Ignatzschineria indica]MDM1545497.1 Retron-type reverse transcriptase [Ignatzschineria indica]